MLSIHSREIGMNKINNEFMDNPSLQNGHLHTGSKLRITGKDDGIAVCEMKWLCFIDGDRRRDLAAVLALME